MTICKVYNENLVEDEYHLLIITPSTYKVIREKYDHFFNEYDNVSFILQISIQKDEHTCVWELFLH